MLADASPKPAVPLSAHISGDLLEVKGISEGPLSLHCCPSFSNFPKPLKQSTAPVGVMLPGASSALAPTRLASLRAKIPQS